jgi:hypothetical protein
MLKTKDLLPSLLGSPGQVLTLIILFLKMFKFSKNKNKIRNRFSEGK